MSRDQARPTVTITSRALWRIRLARELPRYLLCGASLAGLAASARFAIAPPSPACPPRRFASRRRQIGRRKRTRRCSRAAI